MRKTNDKDREPKIDPTAEVGPDVELGDWSVVHAGVHIRGKAKIGRAAWILHDAEIGGGQYERGKLESGEFLHMGRSSLINIADEVHIGNEVGLGGYTSIYTHGNYLSEYDGFPFRRGAVWIGDHVWLPQATVLPDVLIGDNTVVSAMSLVNTNLLGGCLYGGVPARLIKANCYPAKLTDEVRYAVLTLIWAEAQSYGVTQMAAPDPYGRLLIVNGTSFFPADRTIIGPATQDTERVKDIFRRHGIRFRYYDNDGEYTEWD